MLIADILDLDVEEYIEEELHEGVVRQVRRYGNKMRQQFRCQGGDKDGRLVSDRSQCGIRKNPKRVRAGQKSSRVKKGERVRKSNFTKRKTLSQILVRRNKMLKGATADDVVGKTPERKSDNITSKGTEPAKSTS